MIDVELPPGPAAGALVRGFAACLASVTEVPVAEVPLPDDDLAHALGAWRAGSPGTDRGWCRSPTRCASSGRGGGSPSWRRRRAGRPPRRPCWRSARRRASCSARRHRAARPGDRRAAHPRGLRRRLPRPGAAPATGRGGPARHRRRACRGTRRGGADAAARGRAGSRRQGLDGDRYAAGAGTFSSRGGRRPGYDLTLIAAEVLDELAAAGQPLDLPAPGATSSPAASTSTPSSGGASASGTSSARASGCASPASTSTGSADRGSCGR